MKKINYKFIGFIGLLSSCLLMACGARTLIKLREGKGAIHPWNNQYSNFDSTKIHYLEYSKKINDPIPRVSSNIARSFVCIFPKMPDTIRTSYLNPNNKMNIEYQTLDNQLIKDSLVVGDNFGKKFECMGACGKGCPEIGIPIGFTYECLIHDHCTYKFGILPEIDREKHPQCGDLYLKAVDDWCQAGHFFMEE